MENKTFELGLDKMEKVYLPKLDCYLSYDRPDDDERVNFYDAYGELLDCVYKDDEELKKYIEHLKSIDDVVDVFGEFCDTFDWGDNIEDCLFNYVEDLEYDDEKEEIYRDIKEMSVADLTYKYDINKIGDHYFKGWW